MKKNLRMTHQREIILEELRLSNTHPTADELYTRIRKRLPRISLATVYRNLSLLSDKGIIRKLEVSGRQKRFDWDIRNHHHIYCVQCYRVDNVKFSNQTNMELAKQQSQGYAVSGHHVEFFGICPACQKANQKKDKEKQGMACKKTGSLTEKQQEVLAVLAEAESPAGSKDIAEFTSLESKQVSGQITALKKKGFVTSPVRCKYEITDKGREALHT